jgi:hypothetical protein
MGVTARYAAGKDEPRAVGPGVLVHAVLVAGDGFEPPTFGL